MCICNHSVWVQALPLLNNPRERPGLSSQLLASDYPVWGVKEWMQELCLSAPQIHFTLFFRQYLRESMPVLRVPVFEYPGPFLLSLLCRLVFCLCSVFWRPVLYALELPQQLTSEQLQPVGGSSNTEDRGAR